MSVDTILLVLGNTGIGDYSMTLTREERVFCGKYEELGELANPKNEYDLLKISGILRHTLNDGLFYHANKRTKLDIQFQIIEIPQDLKNELLTIIDSKKLLINDVPFSSPEIGNHKHLKTISPSDFLKLIAQRVKDETDSDEDIEITSITVREVISYGANILGGIHTGKPKSKDREKHIELEKFRWHSLGGVNWSLRQLMPIAQIVLRGLKPLYDSLQSMK